MPPFKKAKEYYSHMRKEEELAEFARSAVEFLNPKREHDIYITEVFESVNNSLYINYWIGSSDDQDWIPLECLWSDNWKDIVKAAKDEEKRKYKERQKQRDVKRTADIEVDERKLLATLIEKYPDEITDMCAERHQYDCCPEDE